MVSRLLDDNNTPEVLLALNEGMDEYLEQVGKAMERQIDIGFDRGTDALGRPWEPLKDPDSGDILVDSGQMRNSIGYAIDKDSNNVRVGSNSEYLPYHEFGVPSQGLPRRPILQPAATWAGDKLLVPEMKSVFGKRIDLATI